MFGKKKLTDSELLEKYLPLLREFAEANGLEVSNVGVNRWDIQKDTMEVKFRINCGWLL